MKEIKNVIICGLGAIGAIYATTIVQNKNINLKILLDKERIEKYKKFPTFFNGSEFSFDYITPEEINFDADLIFIATKSSGLDIAIKDIKNFVKKDTIIISLLNGIESEERIAKTYGIDKILYSYYIGHTSTRKGRHIEHDGVYKTVFGNKNNKILDEKVLCVKDFFDKTKIKYEIPEDMEYARWWKFLVNIGYNQASAVLRAPYADFQKSTKTNQIAIELMKEAAEIAKVEGVQNTEKMIPEVLKTIEKMLPQTKTSMLQDVEAKRQTEVDIFAGYIEKLGKKHNIKTPYNSLFYKLIKAIDEANSHI